MKKLFSLLVLLSFVTIGFSQSTKPRFGIKPGDDNTGRVLTYKFVNTAEVPLSDTVKLNPNAFATLVVPSNSITDSISYSLKTLATSYVGDRIEFSFLNSTGSGHKVKFVGTGWQFSSSGSSISLTTAKRATISFRFDGAQWVETGRVVQ